MTMELIVGEFERTASSMSWYKDVCVTHFFYKSPDEWSGWVTWKEWQEDRMARRLAFWYTV